MARINCGFTLEQSNLDWLRKQASRESRSMSNMLDRLLELLQAEGKKDE